MTEMLFPDENPQAKRLSSINQFSNFLSVMKDGAWSPVVFDQLDGIRCETVKSHPVILETKPTLGHIFPEKQCTYVSDRLLSFHKEGVEQRLLPEAFGGKGEFYDAFIDEDSLVGLGPNTVLGLRSVEKRRVGLDYVVSDQTLPPVE